ncbi:MAG: 4a-hydroxytetrahydrobiopterin dehydratase [Planctomycetes bacterium]|nr:4a-hydroxytetrahydrobiopterin dehydratase [Planctomycetota bacterium]
MERPLSEKRCAACRGDIPALTGKALARMADRLAGGWTIVDEHHLEKDFSFRNFRKALDFTNELGEIAEVEGHHPDILLSWGRVQVTIYSHKVDGLTESDFILAAKYDECSQAGSATEAKSANVT